MQQRLFEITYLLTEHDCLTAAQLAERFGVSRRTIYRDIDALSGAGIPIYTEKGRGGGIRMLPDFVLDKTMFTEEERRQLMVQLDSLAGIDMPGSREISDKLAALFGRRDDGWLEVDFMPWAGGDEAHALFNLLRDAILQHRLVSFTYSGSTMGVGSGPQAGLNPTDPRIVEPCKLVFRGQGWYLQAFCRARQDFRVFKINRMHDVEVLPEVFEPKEPPSLRGDIPSNSPAHIVKLRISGRGAFRVYDEFPSSAIEKQANGSFIVTWKMTDDEWLTGYFLSYGADLEVLEPEFLRLRMASIFAEGQKNYI